MTVTSSIQSPSTQADTPTPYRVPTSAVLIWTPREATTAEHTAIRTQIEPNRGFWQFPLPTMPWEAVLAFKVWASTVGIGALAIAAYTWLGAHR